MSQKSVHSLQVGQEPDSTDDIVNYEASGMDMALDWEKGVRQLGCECNTAGEGSIKQPGEQMLQRTWMML
ncbi:unnamed protein product [Lota lota]